MTFEDAYFGTRPTGDDVVPRLIQELLTSPDAYTRGKFCELLGEMGDSSAIPVLAEELSHPDQRVRCWAAIAMEELKSRGCESKRTLQRSCFGFDDD
ncbi:HEAT repeat domain-containing protein [Xanthomonas sacchari]|uniref:HEAT repeat domain-containing protein n=1 Tax=Xanthomonas sacchari TaxID=56458 RepID=UPI0035283CB8